MSDSIKILVCAHKTTKLPNDKMYLPIQVGKEISDVSLGIQCDNEINGQQCDNISSLNGIYCEMTGMYWAWKNIRTLYPDTQYVGLCHYRRYFNWGRLSLNNQLWMTARVAKMFYNLLISRRIKFAVITKIRFINSIESKPFFKSNANIKKYSKKYDIIVPKPEIFVNCSVRDYFNANGAIYNKVLDEIIQNDYPEYYNTYSDMMRGTKMYSANMMIISMDYLDEYCNFCFDVLEKHIQIVKSRKICLSPESEGVYSRISGYLAEIITSTFIIHKKNNLRIKEINKFFINNEFKNE